MARRTVRIGGIRWFDIRSRRGQQLLAEFDAVWCAPPGEVALAAMTVYMDARTRVGSRSVCACGWSIETGADDEHRVAFGQEDHNEDGQYHDPDGCPRRAAVLDAITRDRDAVRAMASTTSPSRRSRH